MATTNSSIIPSAKDLIMVFPRLAQRAGSFAYNQFPEHVDVVLNKIWSGGSTVTDGVAANTSGPSVTKFISSTIVQNAATASASAATSDDGMFSWVTSLVNMEGFRGFGGIFSYFGSRWALATFAMSIFLNRTHFYASSRQNLSLRWKTRTLLYLMPMALLVIQMVWILQAMRCQTSPDFPLYRYGDPRKKLAINFGGEGGFIHQASSTLLFWQDDAQSCSAMSMALENGDKLNVLGSFSLLWRFFLTICFSQFIETLSCALQGRQPMPETGMTTFEHSLAFAECEAMISSALGLDFLDMSKTESTGSGGSISDGDVADAVLLNRSMILRRLNVPSEVLLICFISCLSHISSSVLAVTGKRHKYRLINTTIWALCYLSAFIWSIVRIVQDPFGANNELGILRFPTVCIIGFVPHILILCGIVVCGFIYTAALLVTVISLPPDAPKDLSLRQRFALAFDNLQANVQFSSSSSMKLNWHEDFYTNLLKVGFNILTAASDAVYLNEANKVRVHSMTWLERKRLLEINSVRARSRNDMTDDGLTYGVVQSDPTFGGAASGYGVERKAKGKSKDNARGRNDTSDSGVGLSERRSRLARASEFVDGVIGLVARILARLIHRVLSVVGIRYVPAWLLKWTTPHPSANLRVRSQGAAQRAGRMKDFWVVDPAGGVTFAKDGNVDLEEQTRKRLVAMSRSGVSEEVVDDKLYSWWKRGGWWGEVDGSGDYEPPSNDNDDLTSMISASDALSQASEWSTDDDDGRRTPTQDEPYPSNDHSRPFAMTDLARLLDPQTADDREEARILSRHLGSEQIMTRSRYRKKMNSERARLLLPAHGSRQATSDAEADEEAELEQFILSQRQRAAQQASAHGQSWASGAEGMGASGPQCVVCQSSPRSVLVWPCGCLSVCDECRVGLAAKNFGSCLCCRTSVTGYSRLYVP